MKKNLEIIKIIFILILIFQLSLSPSFANALENHLLINFLSQVVEVKSKEVSLERERMMERMLNMLEDLERARIHKVSQISLFIDQEEKVLESPLLFKDDQIFIPLREITKLLSFSLYDLGEQRFRIISPEGKSREIAVAYLKEKPVITQKELKEYFSAESQFDATEKMLYIQSSFPTYFKTYRVSRPKEELPKAKIELYPVEEDTSKDKPRYIPEIARPSTQLNAGVAYTYINYHTTSPYKDLITSLSGQAEDFQVKGFREDKEMAGKFDHSSTWLNLERPGLELGLFDQGINLHPLRGQYQTLTGIKLIKGWSPFNKTTFLGGDIENSVSGSAGTVKYLGNIVGLQEELWPVSWLGIKGLSLYLENEAAIANLAGTTSFPRKNLINFFDTNLKLTPQLSFLSQLAHCNYSPDNEPHNTISDWNWRIGPELKSQRYNLRFAYEFLGDKYASLGNPAAYQDYKGWELAGDYKVFDDWLVSGYLTLYQNNVEEDAAKITNKNQSFTFSSAYNLPKEQALNFTYSNTTTNPSGPQPGVSTKSNLYRTDYSLPIFGHHLLLNYQYYRLDSVNSLDYYSHTTGGTIFKSFGLGSTWNLHQDYTHTLYTTATDKSNLNSSFSLYYRFNPYLDLSFNPSYSREKLDARPSTQTVSSSLGLWYKTAPQTTLRLDYSISNHNIKKDKSWPRDWSILFSLIKNFGFSSPARLGRIKGRILMDTNNNTKLDPADEPVAEIKVKLEDGRMTKTDKQGNFTFLYVIPQKQKISLDLEDLPLEWTSKDLEKEISVEAFRTKTVEMFLMRGSSIGGKVFIDENRDFLFQDTEEPLEGIRVTLLPEEQVRTTDEEGNFRFDNILLGRYKLKIILEDLPAGYGLVSDETKETLILPGEEIKDLNFIISLKPTIIQKF